MSVRSRSGSFKEEDTLQSIQEVLQDKGFPPEYSHTLSSPSIGSTQYSQSLKDLIINSVSMETSGDVVISSLIGQQPSADDFVIGFKSLVHFLDHESTAYKTELKQNVLYPIFICCFLSLIKMEEVDKAISLYMSVSEVISRLCTNAHDLKELALINSKESLFTSSLAEKFRKHKYIARLSNPAFTLLFSFLKTLPTTCLINLIETHFSLEVFGNNVSVSSGDHKPENKKALTFVKPQIHPISEIDICLSYSKPKPHPLPPLPQVDNESLAVKAEYQQRLVTAAQQLEPSPPSLLLCSITTPTNYNIHCSSICQRSKSYAYSLNNSSIMVSSWLPTATDGLVTNATNKDSCSTLRGHSGPAYGLSFNRSGEYLLSASEDTSVRLWNLKSSSCVVSFEGHQYPVWDVSFSPVDGYFATCSYDNTARLWSSEYVYPLRIFAGHEESVEVARFHPNGNYVGTGSLDHTLRLWDINSGNSVRLFTGKNKQPIVTLAFSPFGKQIASGANDGTITLWDISTARSIMEFKGHTSKITSLSFSSDGTILASCGFDHTIKLWNIKATLGPSYQELVCSYSTSTVLPLTTSFIQRNCLVVMGTIANESSTLDDEDDDTLHSHYSYD